VAGPQILTASEMAGTWRRVTGRHAVLVRVPVPGRLGRVLRAGGLTASQPDVSGTTSFDGWLAAGGAI